MTRTDDLVKARSRLAEVPDDDVPALIDAAREHGVEAWLAACAPSATGRWGALAAQRPLFLAARMRALGEAQRLGKRLDRHGHRWAVLKGLSISHTSYPRPDLRYSVDLDVLVPPAAFEEIVIELVANGYRLLDVNWPVLAERMPGELRLRAANGTLIDLHWSVLNQPRLRAALNLPTNELLERAELLEDDGVWVLSPADRLLHAAVHAALSGGNRLIWLVDLDRIVRARQADWPAFVEVARVAAAGPSAAVALTRAKSVLGTPIPDDVLRQLVGSKSRRFVQRVVDSRGILSPDPSRPTAARAFSRSGWRPGWQSQIEFVKHGISWLRTGAPRSRRPASWLDPDDDSSALRPVADKACEHAYFATAAAAR